MTKYDIKKLLGNERIVYDDEQIKRSLYFTSRSPLRGISHIKMFFLMVTQQATGSQY